MKSRDRRFDGRFVTAVHSTGIYCRPSCPARTPAPGNVSFFPTTAAAQGAGFRACKRCLPDATPGDPEWDVTADVVGRAMRLIADGVVDREGVAGLATRLGYTSRHLGRLLSARLGAGPLALARARRAQAARVLVESTDLDLAQVAFASGFSSLRQFNQTFAEVYACAPSVLRRTRVRGSRGESAPARDDRAARPRFLTVRHRLAVRTPFSGGALLRFLADRAVPGVEDVDADWYARTLDLPHGPGVVRLQLMDHVRSGGVAQVDARMTLADVRDLGTAVERCRRLLDADCDPVAVDDHLADDPLLAPLVRRNPGLRVPGHVSGAEIAVRAVLGQQVSLASARTSAARLVTESGEVLPQPFGPRLTHLFPTAEVLAGRAPTTYALPRRRAEALVAVTSALASGEVRLDHGLDRDEVRERLLAIKGIGPWTTDYVLMRGLAHPDVLLASDLGSRRALERLGADDATRPARWRPWRSYAQAHLWRLLIEPTER